MSSTLNMPIGRDGLVVPDVKHADYANETLAEFSSRQVYETYYKNFLSWDLQMGDMRGPDHVFYFTMRDSVNFGMEEHFGLIGQCGETKCKLQKPPDFDSYSDAGLDKELVV
eukprot:CAMPEP_0115533138 /NCGR_PEP_ID=MMETSP0271-20121206/85957_1 /TAXON_ID=71861 /ORGANISM="Scrippsiella trochoidea, Strain CCMP3099" /LENGTH=111 /DNA_ID=CAMNT_0002965491 /DNA_START=134 /DNA_END=470 /DNA_ORIENTATION=-